MSEQIMLLNRIVWAIVMGKPGALPVDTNTLLTVVGVVATVVLGAWAIYLAKRYSQRVEIAYFEGSCLSLFDDITQGIDDLQIQFRGSPVSKNIVLLQGYIINAGRRDVSEEMVEKPLRIVTPAEFDWIDCQVTSMTKDLKVSAVCVSPRQVEFNLRLFKVYEYFKFDALIAAPSDDGRGSDSSQKPPSKVLRPSEMLRKVIRFEHRISDLRDVKKIQLDTFGLPTLFRRIGFAVGPKRLDAGGFFYNVYPVLMGVVPIALGALMFLAVTLIEHKELGYRVSGSKNEEIIVRARIHDDQIFLSSEGGYKSILSADEFNQLRKTAVVVATGKQPLIYAAFGYMSVGIFVLLAWLFLLARTHKYRKIIRLAELVA